MQIETPPQDKPYDKPEGERRGLVIVNTGDGKGKSTAAFGLALRAHGRGKAVKIYQFMKVPTARFGEHRMFEKIGIPIEGLGDGFSWKSQDLEHSAQLARDGWEKARAAIFSGEYFLVVLDEITYPLIYGWLPLDGVLDTLRNRPKDVHVVFTGRRCPPEIIEAPLTDAGFRIGCDVRCRHIAERRGQRTAAGIALAVAGGVAGGAITDRGQIFAACDQLGVLQRGHVGSLLRG